MEELEKEVTDMDNEIFESDEGIDTPPTAKKKSNDVLYGSTPIKYGEESSFAKASDTQPRLDLSDADTYTRRLQHTLEQGRAYENKIVALSQRIKDRQRKKKDIEYQLYLDVHNETTELKGGGEFTVKPKFTNEKSREAEVNKRQYNHAEYKVLSEEDEKDHLEIKRLQVELDYFKKEFKSIEIVLKIKELRL